ncbi:MAG: PPC domain-containing protein [Xenococcus sp. (in: cyanobacteria)]
MAKLFVNRWYYTFLLAIALNAIAIFNLPAEAENRLYNPGGISSDKEISDTLSQDDIPTGEGGFARDYFIELEKGDQVAIDLTSDEFDTMVMLIADDGSTVAENDDAPDGTTNSLLFSRIVEDGKYIVRVRAFGETSGGKFNLKFTRLKPVK